MLLPPCTTGMTEGEMETEKPDIACTIWICVVPWALNFPVTDVWVAQIVEMKIKRASFFMFLINHHGHISLRRGVWQKLYRNS